MLLTEFLSEYKARKGEKGLFNRICKENDLSYKKLKPYFKQIGVIYDNANFEWIISPDNEGEKEALLQLDLSTYNAAYKQRQQTADPAESDQQQPESADLQQQSGDNISHIMAAQLFDIVDLLQQINGKLPAADQVAAAIQQQPDPISDAPLAFEIHRISQQLKARKTINISSTCAGWLDSFSATKGFHIGDLVTLAVMQLKERVDPENERQA